MLLKRILMTEMSAVGVLTLPEYWIRSPPQVKRTRYGSSFSDRYSTVMRRYVGVLSAGTSVCLMKNMVLVPESVLGSIPWHSLSISFSHPAYHLSAVGPSSSCRYVCSFPVEGSHKECANPFGIANSVLSAVIVGSSCGGYASSVALTVPMR